MTVQVAQTPSKPKKTGRGPVEVGVVVAMVGDVDGMLEEADGEPG